MLLYKTVIFDLDGTLTDSKIGIVSSVKYALTKMNRPFPPDDVLQKFLGPPLVPSFMQYCNMTQDEACIATEYYRERYIPIGWRENTVFQGIRSLLKELKKRGAYLAVATGKPQHTSIDILRYFGLLDYFDAVAGPLPEQTHCTKAELIRRVLPNPENAVMIGDNIGDIKGAHEVGIDSIAIFYGYDSKEELSLQNPTHGVHTVAELQELLLSTTVHDKGIFLSVEGLDGSGKTTQMEALRRLLYDFGFSVHLTREPGGCEISENIRNILLSQKENGMSAMTEALLFAAARSQHVHDVIKPSISKGKVVLCDRYVDSSIAYQGEGRELGVDVVTQINSYAINGCYPDVTIYLKIDHATSIARRKNATALDRIEQQSPDFFERIEKGFNQLTQKYADRYLLIDATKPVEEVEKEIATKLLERLCERGLL